MASLTDLDRRVSALERAAKRDRSVERATAEIVAETEKRLTDRVSATERRMVDVMNERFDAVMAAIDRLSSRDN